MNTYKKLVKELKKTYPEYSISVRRLKIAKNTSGDCEKISKNKFRIRISKNASEQEACDILLHEYCHVLSWEEHEQGKTHGIVWGKKFSEVYRIYEKICDNIN